MAVPDADVAGVPPGGGEAGSLVNGEGVNFLCRSSRRDEEAGPFAHLVLQDEAIDTLGASFLLFFAEA